jgi:peptidoglycan/LPS O-acetylase OafA/YrhL
MRGLAALSVVASHYINAYDLPSQNATTLQVWTYSPLHIVWDGFAAVSLFYVLSGLVLSLKYFRESSSPMLSRFHLTQYLTSRVFRIFPPYLFVFLLSYALRRWAGFFNGITVPPASTWLFSTWKASIPLAQLVREGLLIQGGDYSLVPQGWTLPIELVISFLVPVGILLASHRTGWLIFFSLLLIGPLGSSYYIFHFAAGILVAKYYEEIRTRIGKRTLLKILLLVFGILFYTFRFTLPVYFSRDLPPAVPWLATGIGSALLLVVVITSQKAGAFLSLPWLKFIGKISYSIYLLHFLVLITLTPRALKLLAAPAESLLVAWWFGLAFTVLVTIGFAALTHRYVELPSIALGKSIPKWFEAQKTRRLQSGQAIQGK